MIIFLEPHGKNIFYIPLDLISLLSAVNAESSEQSSTWSEFNSSYPLLPWKPDGQGNVYPTTPNFCNKGFSRTQAERKPWWQAFWKRHYIFKYIFIASESSLLIFLQNELK